MTHVRGVWIQNDAIEKKKDRRLFFCRIPTKTRLRVFLGDQHLCTGMSKRRKSDTGVDADEEAKLEPQTKHVITALSLRLAGVGQLMQLNTFRSHLNECGFPVPESTLSIWRKLLPEDPDLFIPKQISGRPRSLTYEDEQLLGGFILHQNAMVRQVTVRNRARVSQGRVERGNFAAHGYLLCARRWFQ